MKAFRFLLGLAALVTLAAFSAPAAAIGPVHDPGFHALTITPADYPAPVDTATDHVAIIPAEVDVPLPEKKRSSPGDSRVMIAETDTGQTSYIDLHLRC